MLYTMDAVVEAINASAGDLTGSWSRDEWLVDKIACRARKYLLEYYSAEAIAERKAQAEAEQQRKKEELRRWAEEMGVAQ
jgi:hypothetical protein